MKAKLRNKTTGEIGSFIIEGDVIRESVLYGKKYYSLAELNEEWEDYEEGHRVYYLDYTGDVFDILSEVIHSEIMLKMKRIGNYFETREEAEKAVEKLKAWKRLRDKGFEFRGYEIIDGTIEFMILPKGDYREKVYEDLDICFGGKE